MSERLKHIETGPTENEHLHSNEVLPPSAEKREDAKSETVDIDKTREQIREIHQLSPGSSKKSLEDTESDASPKLVSVTETLAKTLSAVRHQLTPSEKSFSKVIHNPIISKVSEVTAKTLARPYAILSGSLIACIGSAFYIYYTRHLGYRYNYFVPILLFFAGLIVSIAVEILYKFTQRLR